jgi:sulfite exporter TauE/SafE
VLALGIVKRFLKILAGVVLLLLGLYSAVGAVMATILSRLSSAARFTNLLMLIPAAFMIIMAVVLFRMARD